MSDPTEGTVCLALIAARDYIATDDNPASRRVLQRIENALNALIEPTRASDEQYREVIEANHVLAMRLARADEDARRDVELKTLFYGEARDARELLKTARALFIASALAPPVHQFEIDASNRYREAFLAKIDAVLSHPLAAGTSSEVSDDR